MEGKCEALIGSSPNMLDVPSKYSDSSYGSRHNFKLDFYDVEPIFHHFAGNSEYINIDKFFQIKGFYLKLYDRNSSSSYSYINSKQSSESYHKNSPFTDGDFYQPLLKNKKPVYQDVYYVISSGKEAIFPVVGQVYNLYNYSDRSSVDQNFLDFTNKHHELGFQTSRPMLCGIGENENLISLQETEKSCCFKEVETIFDKISLLKQVSLDIRNEIISSVSQMCLKPPGMTTNELSTIILEQLNQRTSSVVTS